MSLAVSPAQPSTMAAVWTQDWDDATVVAVTTDGGKTFTERLVPGQAPGCEGGSATNPRVAVGPDGSLYVISNVNGGTTVNVSRDLGRTWLHGADCGDRCALAGGNGVSWIATDPGTPRTAYALAGVFGDASSFDEVARTSDGGVTWSDPKPVVPPAPGVANILGQLFVLGDHSVVDVFAQCDNTLSCRGGDAVVKAVFSTDGAAAWSPLPEAGVSIPADGAFDAATDRNGDLLVAFPGPAGAGWAIRTSRSTDRGRTWSEPITAVETTLRPTHVTLAVAGDGTLGLTYADHGSPGLDGAAPYEVWFASSRAGSPWQRTRLAGPTDFASAPAADLHAGDAEAMGIGEWQGLVGVPHGFAAAFALGTPQATIGPTDIFFARR